jgi:hypothetical protein
MSYDLEMCSSYQWNTSLGKRSSATGGNSVCTDIFVLIYSGSG